MRVFIALELPEEFISEVVVLSRSLKASLEGRFLPKDAYHLTLAFLGECDETNLAAAFEALESACSGLCPIPLRCDGLGKFGRVRDATLWLGIAPTPELLLLAEKIRDELRRYEIPFDDKPFKPHITLARRAHIPRVDLPALVFPQDSEATSVTLFKSVLSHEGALYSPLHSAILKAEGHAR